VWHQDLINRLKLELPRWRWKSGLTHRGGTLDGETQKQSIHLEIEYARGHWVLSAYGLLGFRQPQWTLTLEDGQFDSLEGLVTTILAECK
jgi:hypothetical protein